MTSMGTRFSRLARYGLISGLVAHIGFLVLFSSLKLWLLAYINIFSIAIYGLCLFLMRIPRRRSAALVLSWTEIIAHAAIACRILGWSSGFHYYLLSLIPVFFANPRTRPHAKITGVAILVILYIGIDYWSHQGPPWSLVDWRVLTGLRYFNAALCFTIVALLFNFYSSSMRHAERKLRELANTDMLTGLHNRRSLIARASRRRATDSGSRALVLIDVDHFKQINDSYGHTQGDIVLERIASTIAGQLRDADVLSRWGGEEFLALLGSTDLPSARSVAERIRQAVADQTFEHAGNRFTVTLTIGISYWAEGETLETCVARADSALYRGKTGGRNRCETNPPITLSGYP